MWRKKRSIKHTEIVYDRVLELDKHRRIIALWAIMTLEGLDTEAGKWARAQWSQILDQETSAAFFDIIGLCLLRAKAKDLRRMLNGLLQRS